jgi:Cu+-exporting ATPase
VRVKRRRLFSYQTRRKIPVDGKIIKGMTSIDESMLTDESIPVEKMQNDNVIGSTMNKNGAITVEATKSW